MKKTATTLLAFIIAVGSVSAQKVDYSVVSVGEEGSLDLLRVSTDNDYVCMPLVQRSGKGVNWFTNRILDISPDGQSMAYLSQRNNTTNVFIKDVDRQGVSRQRTNRSAVIDFSYSPDGKKICFSEKRGKNTQIFITDAKEGFVCRQVTSGAEDYSPVFSTDMKNIYFARQEKRGIGIWGHDVTNNYLSSYTTGMNPTPGQDGKTIFVARNNNGRGEIWRVNYETGAEDCILSSATQSFYSPLLSPDGSTLVVTGSSPIQNGNSTYWNTDIYTCNVDGTDLRQHTYHAADDLSPVWSRDGRYIYFISQRGSAEGLPNIWRMSYTR